MFWKYNVFSDIVIRNTVPQENPKCLGSPDTSGSQAKWSCNLAFIMKA